MHLNMNRVEKYLRYNILIKLMIEFPCARGTIKKVENPFEKPLHVRKSIFLKRQKNIETVRKKGCKLYKMTSF